MIDVAALAVEQMRAARVMRAAVDEYRAAREEWVTAGGSPWKTDRFTAAGLALHLARRQLKVADRAYEAACDAVDVGADSRQQELFG